MDKTLVSDIYDLHGSAVIKMDADISLEDAIGTFTRNPSFRGIFLLDANQRFVGMITRINLLRWAHLNLTGGKGRHAISISEFFKIVDARKAKDLAGGTQTLYVKGRDTIQTALDKMLDAEEDIIAVLDKEGRVMGDLRLSEVLAWIIDYNRRAAQESK